MDLSDEARERLADLVRLQPTTNGELGDRWGLADGSAVHGYLETELGDYYYRDDDSYIRATEEAAEIAGVETDETTVHVTPLQAQVFDVLSGPEERSDSVVAILHALRDAHGVDSDTDEIEAALRALKRRTVVEVVRRAVPTYRRRVERDAVTLAVED
ncbi:hypothetical protein BRD17_02415 [Halobacteriales archaeon SW_7_68_16]|nr:MAG: hypothetical protein BRD17_02415 [Halobacteriales archaeon SW_7_68_16]